MSEEVVTGSKEVVTGGKLFWRTGEYGVQVDVTVLFCAWCGFALPRLVRPCADWCGTAQTGAALRRLVRPCADWCGPAQTGAALRRLVRPWTDWGAIGELPVFGIRESAIPDRTPGPQLGSGAPK